MLRGTTLDGEGRAAVSRAVGQLVPQDTGTGLHDTILAAYEAARDAARPDVPSHVVVFTDGRNEADQPTLSLEELGQRLAAAKAHADREGQRPVELTVVAFGGQPEAQALKDALEPVGRLPGRAAHRGRGQGGVHPRRRGRHPRVSAAVPDFRG